MLIITGGSDGTGGTSGSVLDVWLMVTVVPYKENSVFDPVAFTTVETESSIVIFVVTFSSDVTDLNGILAIENPPLGGEFLYAGSRAKTTCSLPVLLAILDEVTVMILVSGPVISGVDDTFTLLLSNTSSRCMKET
ncbi:TPA: hypothetical protein DCL89_01620 [candidate division WWE3 bacterium]|uniref:Uncharacterized protein n=1 Tax=candidate division WWE3 bacterium RIFOXYB1_FULL_42_27 TaxID=1802638 RepID=A0A1F4W0E8_UNCKA|nr:MAG: hypothetical protein A2200_01470 [candidate division WWE3 bacterium RIFOXYA1_FULL_41_11]OGC62894.1 MAG: hypothetical protein A2399_01820 [candidate division WWE3 bacterium RIFOXYB1_FULL_42_27]OGC75300.1 MAG: hypothetical protein A2425_03010 [candidate division WWE3 bacterium RIFOXYC1_FULL_42_17]HAI62903.1 hypothetical protein [candidate division WWE3 bacterium]